MKKIQKRIISASVCLFLALSYMFLLPSTLEPHELFVVDNVIPVVGDSLEPTTPDGYFVDDDGVGYFSTTSATVTYYERANPDLSKVNTSEQSFFVANINGYVRYQKVGSELSFYSNSGTLLKSVSSFSYPFISDSTSDSVFVIKTNGAGFSSYTLGGESIVDDYVTNAFITSITANKNNQSAVSFSDSSVVLLDSAGEREFSMAENYSDIAITKGCAVDSEGKYLVSISGISPEVLTIYDLTVGDIYHQRETGGDLRYSPIIRIKKGLIYYETEGALNVLSINKEREVTLDVLGELREIDISGCGEVAILSRFAQSNYLYIYKPNGILSNYYEIDGNVSNLRYIGDDKVYFKVADSIILLR